MDKNVIEKVVLDQVEELESKREDRYCVRKEEAQINLDSNLAQVVIGVRRCGKSTLCFNALEHAGVKYGYINFDDDRLANIDVSDMDALLELLYKHYGRFTHLFLDEIQNVDGWHLFANRLLRSKVRLLITGSNSKLLSGELASHLTGRHHEIELLPFSFADYCGMMDIPLSPLSTKNRGLIQGAFDSYLRMGGFPELFNEKDSKGYIDTLVKNIIRQDIQQRFNIKHSDTIYRLASHILNEAPTLVVKDTLMEIFEFKSVHTLSNYLSYLAQTYLVSNVSKYSHKSRQRVRNEKAYAIDVAMMSNRENALAGANLGHRLETLVYLELRRRASIDGGDVYYYSERSSECDFVVCSGKNIVAAYQVAYDISSSKTRSRELRGCMLAMNKLGCRDTYLLTMNDTEDVETEKGVIKIRPVWLWMVGE